MFSINNLVVNFNNSPQQVDNTQQKFADIANAAIKGMPKEHFAELAKAIAGVRNNAPQGQSKQDMQQCIFLVDTEAYQQAQVFIDALENARLSNLDMANLLNSATNFVLEYCEGVFADNKKQGEL
jgi:hypothetical protein